MLRAYSTNITTTANSAIPFNTDKLEVGSSVSHTSGASNIEINIPGYYEVHFDISATTAEAVSDPINIQLYANGIAIPDALISKTITANSYSSMSFSTIIKANIGNENQSAVLTVVPNADLTISYTAIGVNRL